MTDGASQGLFVIVAVVIFGIFVLISYVLFRDNLKTGLSSIFKDSIEEAQDSLNKGENLFSKARVSSSGATFVRNLDGTMNLSKKGKLSMGSPDPVMRSHVFFILDVPDLKEGDSYTFKLDMKITEHDLTEGVPSSSTVNIRTIDGLKHNQVQQSFKLDKDLNTWKTYKVKIKVGKEKTNLEKMIRGSISIGGQEESEILIRNMEIYKT